MIRKSNLFILIILMSGFTLAFAQNKVTIKGNVEGDFKGFNKIYVYGTGITTDSCLIQHGSFELNIPFTRPMLIQLYCEYEQRTKNGLSTVGVFVDKPGVVYYTDVAIEKGFHSGKLSGMKSVEDLRKHYESLTAVSKEVQAELAKKYGDTLSPNSSSYKAHLNDYYVLNSARSNQVTTNFIKDNPDAHLAALLLARGISSMPADELENNFQLLSKEIKESDYGKMVSDYLAGTKLSAVGQVLGDFSATDPEGRPFSYSQLKGKYVMIDFWASWCGPCKASFPHMKALYEKYKSDRFEIYSISVDESKSDWLAELKKQRLPWLQALDTEKIAKSRFAVNGVPTVFLIDPQGKVLVKAVGLDQSGNGPIEKQLTEIFGSK